MFNQYSDHLGMVNFNCRLTQWHVTGVVMTTQQQVLWHVIQWQCWKVG